MPYIYILRIKYLLVYPQNLRKKKDIFIVEFSNIIQKYFTLIWLETGLEKEISTKLNVIWKLAFEILNNYKKRNVTDSTVSHMCETLITFLIFPRIRIIFPILSRTVMISWTRTSFRFSPVNFNTWLETCNLTDNTKKGCI